MHQHMPGQRIAERHQPVGRGHPGKPPPHLADESKRRLDIGRGDNRREQPHADQQKNDAKHSHGFTRLSPGVRAGTTAREAK